MAHLSPKNMLHLSLGALVLRLLAYSIAPNTWAVMAAETLQASIVQSML